MKRISESLVAVAVCGMLAACASTGTKVTTNSDAYKTMARSQQAWCSQFASTCGCTLDDQKVTCALASTCINTGSCQQSQ
jgi:outer membrane biogenesis lipoprotein LolB